MPRTEKTEKITFRCTSEQKKRILSNASKENVKTSEYIVNTLLEKKSGRKRLDQIDAARVCDMLSLVSKIEADHERELNVERLVGEVKCYARYKGF